MFKKRMSNYLLKKAEYYSDRFENEKAITYLDKLLIIDGNNIEGWLLKGLCHAFLFQKEESFRCFDKALKIDSNNLNVHLKKGVACYHMDEYELAIDSFNQIIEHIPNETFSLNKIGSPILYVHNPHVSP